MAKSIIFPFNFLCIDNMLWMLLIFLVQCHYQKSLRKAFVIHLVHQTNNICFIVLKIGIDAIFQVLPFFFFFALLKTTVVTFSKKQSLIGYIEVYEQNALIITKRKNLCLHRESTPKKTLFSLNDWNRCQGQSTTSARYRSVTIASLWKQGFTQDSFVDYWRTWAREKDSKYLKKKYSKYSWRWQEFLHKIQS